MCRGDAREHCALRPGETDRSDERIALVEGRDLVGADDLPDGVHPGDRGHAVLAAAFGDAIADALGGAPQ